MSEWVRRSGIQLAYAFELKRLAKWEPPWIVQPKLDGDRMRAVFDESGSVTLYSSEENEVVMVPHLIEQFNSLNLRNEELDGEAYIHGRPQAEIHGIISSGRVQLHEDFEKVEFHMFDTIDTGMPQYERTKEYTTIGQTLFTKTDSLKFVPFYLAYTEDDIYRLLDLFTEEQGFEGFIIRHKNASYRRKRSIYMMKFKPKKEDIYLIVGTKEAVDKYGEPKNTLGSFICVSPPKPEEFLIGAGRIKHAERDELWKIRELLPGNFLRVQYQHLTAKNGVPRSGVAIEVLFDHEVTNG